METFPLRSNKEESSFYIWATVLAMITVFYNIIEGLVSVFLGVEGGTVSLFGFGVDSFVEVVSGIGIWHMIWRMRRNGSENPGNFEKTALKITGTSFYLLTAGLTITSMVNLYSGHTPRTTFWGIIVAVISILSMWALIHYKVKVGKRFNSRALLADAACTKTCLYLSIILLVASVGYEVTGIGLMDSLGALGIAVISFREGREAFDKAEGRSCSCCRQCDNGSK
ncbi:MAG: cation transporter [Candidatus Sulfobium sp.]|jgi:divalent metal cation (Fe/Co/Zn/Cd) transporter